MKCKDMKRALRKQQKEASQQYHRIKELERTRSELREEIAKLRNVNASEIGWNRLRITVQTEVDPLFAYHFDAKELCLDVISGNERIGYKRILTTAFDLIKQDRAAFIRGIGEQMASAVLKAEAGR